MAALTLNIFAGLILGGALIAAAEYGPALLETVNWLAHGMPGLISIAEAAR